MCQLLGMNCNVPTDICFSFEGFHRRGGSTDEHKDGWGIAFFEGLGCRVFLDSKPAVQSAIAELVRNAAIRDGMLHHVFFKNLDVMRVKGHCTSRQPEVPASPMVVTPARNPDAPGCTLWSPSADTPCLIPRTTWTWMSTNPGVPYRPEASLPGNRAPAFATAVPFDTGSIDC